MYKIPAVTHPARIELLLGRDVTNSIILIPSVRDELKSRPVIGRRSRVAKETKKTDKRHVTPHRFSAPNVGPAANLLVECTFPPAVAAGGARF